MKTSSIPKAYEPQKVEDSIYKKWESSGLFEPDTKAKGKPFSISMPPPNATGTLHLGHAVMLAIEDIMARYARMNDRPTLWTPGTDHAAIATENKVEKILLDEKKITKKELGREKFLDEVNNFVADSQSTIKNQVRKMGASCDWKHERYTLDDGLSRCVQEVFIKMYNDGLIYRGHRIVNWCTRCESTLADDEVEHKENSTSLFTFKYDKDFPISIATVRPETKLGDTAVAVHPDDKRYKKYIGKTINANFLGVNLKLKIIADKSIDPKFGTGALGVTPAHSMADAELAHKHKLETIQVIDEKGNIKPEFGEYSGLPVLEARLRIAEELKNESLLQDSEPTINNLSVCYRCDTPVEPLVSEQWFVSVDKKIPGRNKSLKQMSVEAVKNNDIEIIPKQFNKTYFNWMNNLHDWCISRQIWFGHRIPVWYCVGDDKHACKLECKEPMVQINKPKECVHCGSRVLEQDPDTLDTWFSSSMWTFSTLLDKPKKNDTLDSWIERNKKKGKDLANYHPTTVMETGYDILFFWVARMILMTTYVLDEVPFKTVYLHGLVRDKQGKKMSKSLGNGIDPLDMIKEYGADATRLSLVIGTTPGNDSRLYEEKIAGYRNFVNKIWNIARFILMADSKNTKIEEKTLADKWIESRLQNLITEVTAHYEKHEYSIAGEKIYEFMWHELADWYVEISKQQDHTLAPQILLDAIKLLHPFTPFVTEEIFQLLKESKLIDSKDKFLASSQWPTVKTQNLTSLKKIESDFKAVQELITSIRDLRATYKLPYSDKLDAAITTKKHKNLFQEQELVVEALTKVRIQVLPSKPVEGDEYIREHASEFDIYIKIGKRRMLEQEKSITKEKENLEQYISTIEKKLANKKFVENAPTEVVKQEQQKLDDAQSKLKKL
jgi:valyl-tRNA synthetase